jgi:hypothetical protein
MALLTCLHSLRDPAKLRSAKDEWKSFVVIALSKFLMPYAKMRLTRRILKKQPAAQRSLGNWSRLFDRG